jgi:hypothetical protein
MLVILTNDRVSEAAVAVTSASASPLTSYRAAEPVVGDVTGTRCDKAS